MRDILNEAAGLGRDPVMASQKGMQPVLPKRFYSQARPGLAGGRFGVFLDGRPVRTPARNLLELPSEAAAALVAAEFDAQREHVDPAAMPVTRLVNTVVDGVAPDPSPVRDDMFRFAACDLVCYRAGSPRGLAQRQALRWDPLVEWLRDEAGANLVLAEGVMHVEQPAEAVAAVGRRLAAFVDPFALGALHSVTTLTGSVVIALAVGEGRLDVAAAWEAANVDEQWNVEQWGEDAEAERRRAGRRMELQAAALLLAALPDRGRARDK